MSRIAAIQMASGSNVAANLQIAYHLIRDAVNMGAKLIILPENFALMAMLPNDNIKIGEQYGNGIIQNFLSQQAKQFGIWLIGGTLPIITDNSKKVRSACLVFDNTGKQIARYDKIHLFDVTTNSNEQYCESEVFESGEQIIIINTPYGRLGLAVCYDLRFPELFRCMLSKGIDLIGLPAAFTATTGKAHWEILLRARAIENLCYIIAANQGGYHVNGRETYGNSMIVDPWGVVLTRLNRGTGVICADIDLEQQTDLRHKFPVADHRKVQCQLRIT
ncbi:carbon-nitrogen hydrolase family protein [Candidatus Halobeggiatoa sp. HSG11]|nr:carbon-nitrogen hydrolase family protein [Candidatus Halobeggiatoa sp. HSG11]